MIRAFRQRMFLAAALFVAGGSAHATGPVWHGDYAAARKESFEKNKPIVLVFGGEQCMWCRKLEATTLRDPGVVAVLGERFVCLKVDGDREFALTQALKVQTYPTLVVAAPDGKILATIDGYHDAGKLIETLNRVAPPVITPTPEWMVRDFQDAARAVAISDYSRAIALLREVVKDGGDRTIQAKARKVLGDLEGQANIQLSLARTLHQKGRSQEAVDVLTDLLRSYAGTQAAGDSATLLAALAAKPEVREGLRIRKARELLARAKDDFQSQQFLGCLESCEVLVTSFSDLAEGAEAKKLATDVHENPEYLAKAVDALNHRSGAMYLALAESWMKKDQPEQAAVCLERAMQVAPGSRPAEVAQAKLGQLNRSRTSAYPSLDRKPER